MFTGIEASNETGLPVLSFVQRAICAISLSTYSHGVHIGTYSQGHAQCDQSLERDLPFHTPPPPKRQVHVRSDRLVSSLVRADFCAHASSESPLAFISVPGDISLNFLTYSLARA